MKIGITSLGLPAALLAASLFGACQNTARGLEQDTENNAAKAKAASQDAAAAAERAGQEAKQMAAKAADATMDAASVAAQKTKDAAATAVDKTKDAAYDAKESTKAASAEAEQKSKSAAHATASAMDAAAQTLQIKTALIADKTVDASDINVDSNGSTMTVTLKGHVPTAAQKATAERIAKSKAPDYKVVNLLGVKG
jgi:osmotically-inducible protein OsmY